MVMLNLFSCQEVPVSLFEGKKVLDIGCGRRKLPNSIGLDHVALPGVDIVADLNQRLPFEDNEFDVVHADQVLEHISNLTDLVYEIHRVLKPGGKLIAHVPYFRSSWAHIDPTHVRCFTIQGMNFYAKKTYQHQQYQFREEAFSDLEIFLNARFPSTPIMRVMSALALKNPGGFENSYLSFLYPFAEISYLLTK
jgi:SAM-dependent methyltransferase